MRLRDFGELTRIVTSWLTAIAVILVPVVLAYVGANINRTIAETEVSADYVRLAVEILSAEPASEEESDADRALRDWAVDVLVARSPVTLEPTLIEALSEGDVVLSPALTMYPFLWPDPASLSDGNLPEGCVLTINTPAVVFGKASSASAAVGHLNSGAYDALEIRTAETQSFIYNVYGDVSGSPLTERMVRVEQGWARLTFGSYLDDATCRP